RKLLRLRRGLAFALRGGGDADHGYLPLRCHRAAEGPRQGRHTHIGDSLADQHIVARDSPSIDGDLLLGTRSGFTRLQLLGGDIHSKQRRQNERKYKPPHITPLSSRNGTFFGVRPDREFGGLTVEVFPYASQPSGHRMKLAQETERRWRGP